MRRYILSRSYKAIIAGTLLASLSLPALAATELPPAKSFSGAYLAGRIAISDRQSDIAISYLQQALDFDRNSEMVQRDLFLTLMANGKFNEAVPVAILLRNNKELERFTKPVMAADAMNRKHFKQAISVMKYSNPDSLDTITCGVFAAWAKFGQGQRRAAINDIAALEGQEWFRFFKNYHLALMYSLNGQKAEAEKAFTAALKDQDSGAAFPDSYERVIIAYASFQWRNKNVKGAIETLSNGEKLLSGRDTLANLRLAAQNGKQPPALVQSASDGASEIIYNIGTALNRAKAENVAALYLQISLAMRPNSDATIFQLADLSANTDDHKTAIEYYSKIQQGSPYYRESQLRMAMNLADDGQEDKAIELLNGLVKQFGADERVYTGLASIYMQKEDFANTVQILDRYLNQLTTTRPENWPLFYQRAIAYERLKLWDKAELDFNKALELQPNQPQVLNYLGYSLVDRDMKLEEALKMIKKAAELRPQDGAIIDSLGWAYYKLGRFNDAVRELERAVKLRPEDSAINDHLGDAYWMAGRKLEATFQWHHAADNSKIEPDELKKVQQKLKHGLKADGSINEKLDEEHASSDKPKDAPADATTSEDAPSQQPSKPDAGK
ncbi:tetratricopeptide repeat protein [Bartonella sp. HY329]|uniref:tetratricopeptide repeat protein n=1 Tax=unclassified Bartonella TaxID=2645622 RepID=UPI0021CAE2ED|nr:MULTISPECIES: tetratricopeptide repeat protein [unclassified Bartonella]UXM95967.1 tetratricopeptide repeat protein [Bartonella sp. HY329]UXN10292.1 tetratricopeptide repeat protein [Bartonella sp. HY328]